MITPKAFKDDPLRLLRAFTLQATLGFKIDAQDPGANQKRCAFDIFGSLGEDQLKRFLRF